MWSSSESLNLTEPVNPAAAKMWSSSESLNLTEPVNPAAGEALIRRLNRGACAGLATANPAKWEQAEADLAEATRLLESSNLSAARIDALRALTLNNRGILEMRHRGNASGALAFFMQAAEGEQSAMVRDEATVSPLAASQTLLNIGVAYVRLGKYEQGATCARQALAALSHVSHWDLHSRQLLAMALHNLGAALEHQGAGVRAARTYVAGAAVGRSAGPSCSDLTHSMMMAAEEASMRSSRPESARGNVLGWEDMAVRAQAAWPTLPLDILPQFQSFHEWDWVVEDGGHGRGTQGEGLPPSGEPRQSTRERGGGERSSNVSRSDWTSSDSFLLPDAPEGLTANPLARRVLRSRDRRQGSRVSSSHSALTPRPHTRTSMSSSRPVTRQSLPLAGRLPGSPPKSPYEDGLAVPTPTLPPLGKSTGHQAGPAAPFEQPLWNSSIRPSGLHPRAADSMLKLDYRPHIHPLELRRRRASVGLVQSLRLKVGRESQVESGDQQDMSAGMQHRQTATSVPLPLPSPAVPRLAFTPANLPSEGGPNQSTPLPPQQAQTWASDWLPRVVSPIRVLVDEPVVKKALFSAEILAEITAEVLAEPTAEVMVEPTAEVLAEPTAEVMAEPTAEVLAEPVAEVLAEPTAEVLTEPTAEVMAEITAEVMAEPTAEVMAEPTAEVLAEPTAEVMAEPIAEVMAEPVAEVMAEPTAEVMVEPTAEVLAEPTAEVLAEPTAEVLAEPTAEVLAEPTAEVLAEPTAEVLVEPTAEVMVEPTAEVLAEPERLAEVLAEPESIGLVHTPAEPAAEASFGLLAAPVAESVVESTAEDAPLAEDETEYDDEFD